MDFYKEEYSENPHINCRLCLDLLFNENEGEILNEDLDMKINDLFPSNVRKHKQILNFP